MTDAPFEFRVRPSAILDVGGVDRASFLQGQLATDVRRADAGRTIPAVGLTPKGKLLYTGRLVGMPDSLRLLIPASARERVLAHLARYAAFQKVSIVDRSDELTRVSLWPGAAGQRLGLGLGLASGDAAKGNEDGNEDDTGQPKARPIAPGNLLLPGEGDIGAELLVPAALIESTLAGLVERGARALPEEEAEVRRIEAGRPEWGRDADESHLPDEAGFSEAISTDKGCYVGQEIVARMRTYGRANKRLVGFRFPEGILPAGSVLRRLGDAQPSRTEAGRVTSAAHSSRFGPIGLGYAFRDIAAGDRLAGVEDQALGAVVSTLPFS